MRFSNSVYSSLFTIALLGFGGAKADDLDDKLGDAVSSASSVVSSAISKPTFSVSSDCCPASSVSCDLDPQADELFIKLAPRHQGPVL